MKEVLLLIALFGCTDTTVLATECLVDDTDVAPVITDPGPDGRALTTESPKVVQHAELCFFPDPELAAYAGASIGRFVEHLQIPMGTAEEGCIVLSLSDEVWKGSQRVSALATSTKRCVFQECNTRASIVFDRRMLGDQIEWLPNALDHEIGHILSAWGRVLKTGVHLPPGHIMAAVNKRTNHWTQEDVDFWCSGSPCGVTSINEEQYGRSVDLPTGISDAGTSRLSDSGKEGPAPDAEASEDGGY